MRKGPFAAFLTEIMAVARNLCAGRQTRRVPEVLLARGVWGHAPSRILFTFRSPEMLFLEAISSSHLIQVVIFQRYSNHTTPYLKLPSMFKYIFWFLLFFNGDCLTWGTTVPPCPLLATAMETVQILHSDCNEIIKHSAIRDEVREILCAEWSNQVSYRTVCRRGTHVEAFFSSLLAIPQATYYILRRKIPHMCTGHGGVSNQISHLIGFRNRPSVDQICISHGHLHLN